MPNVQETEVEEGLDSLKQAPEEFPLAPDVSAEDAAADEQKVRDDLKRRHEKARVEALKQTDQGQEVLAEEGFVEPEPEEQEADNRSPMEVLADLGFKHEPKVRQLSYGGEDATFMQEPLTFFGKIRFLSYVGEVLDQAMTGENALQINTLFEVPEMRGAALTSGDFSDASTFIQAVGKLLQYAPDFLIKCYLIWLDVPEYDRPWATEALKRIDDDTGFDIIETFLDQNWETLQDFFTNRLRKLGERGQARYQVTQLAQSKPSKPTRQNTQKA